MNETKDFKLIFNENLQSNKIFVGGLTSIIDEGNYFLSRYILKLPGFVPGGKQCLKC